jgi:hypothetical protein
MPEWSTRTSNAQRMAEQDEADEEFMLFSAVLASVQASQSYPGSVFRSPPVPRHTSGLSGQAWLDEILTEDAHEGRALANLGMTSSVFKALVHTLETKTELSPTRKGVSSEEQVAICLFILRTGATYNLVRERFQRSGDTVSKYILGI